MAAETTTAVEATENRRLSAGIKALSDPNTPFLKRKQPRSSPVIGAMASGKVAAKGVAVTRIRIPAR